MLPAWLQLQEWYVLQGRGITIRFPNICPPLAFRHSTCSSFADNSMCGCTCTV